MMLNSSFPGHHVRITALGVSVAVELASFSVRSFLCANL